MKSLFAIAAGAAGLYLLVARRVMRGQTGRIDTQARVAFVSRSTDGAEWLAETTGHIGKWYGHLPLAIAGGALLARRGHRAAAVALVGSSIAAIAAAEILDRVHDQRIPPPGKHDPQAQSFPSGHALETTAVALVAGWVLVRERVAPAALVAPVAILAATSGVGRLVLDRHWVTDAMAGYCAGIALGAAVAATYELAT